MSQLSSVAISFPGAHSGPAPKPAGIIPEWVAGTFRNRWPISSRNRRPSRSGIRILSPESIADTVIDSVAKLPREVNGNALKLFRHSDSFYGQSYFDRNPSPAGCDYLAR